MALMYNIMLFIAVLNKHPPAKPNVIKLRKNKIVTG